MILVGHQAPDFTTTAILSDGTLEKNWNFSQNSEGHYSLLFFYPLDFTFVCPSELIALDKAYSKFKQKGIKVFACSIDSAHTHRAWRNTPIQEGGIGPVQYTLLSDISHQICQMYGVEHYDEKIALRGAFIIDKNSIVRSQIVNDLPLGRNIEEILRTFDALEHHEKFGEVCPVDWTQGQKGMKATPEGVKTFLTETYA
jgi:peroxiredoxin (alkyl hydroperoxide reductase subunit C)